MAKETEKLSEKEQAIKNLRLQISNLKNEGKFKKLYVNLRKVSNDIRKTEGTDIEKKKALQKLCEDTIKEITATLKK